LKEKAAAVFAVVAGISAAALPMMQGRQYGPKARLRPSAIMLRCNISACMLWPAGRLQAGQDR
jgi:hypothetical protein